MKRERLPKDGADYHCTFVKEGAWEQCGQVTTIGISMADWEAFKKLGYRGMRAVCNDHFNSLADGIVK